MISRCEVEEKEPNVWRLRVEVAPEAVQRVTDRVHKEISRRLRIPGFRPGHAPLAVVRRWIGEEEFQNQLFRMILPDATSEALTQHQLKPILLPKYEEIQWSDGKPLTFVAEIVTRPEVKLGDYRGLTIRRIPVEVTDEMVRQAVEEVRLDLARYEPTEEPAQVGDRVRVRYRVSAEGEQPSGNWQTGMFTAGDPGWSPPVPEHLVGIRAGVIREFAYSYPDTHPNPAFAGKRVTVALEAEQVLRRALPQLTDELVKQELGLESVEELKEELRTELERKARRRAREEEKRQIEDQLLQNCSVAVPEPVTQALIQESLVSSQKDLLRNGTSLPEWLARQGKTVDDYVNEIRPIAERTLKLRFILEAIAKTEGIEGEEEVQGLPEEAFEEERERAKRRSREEKTMEWLLAHAVWVDPEDSVTEKPSALETSREKGE